MIRHLVGGHFQEKAPSLLPRLERRAVEFLENGESTLTSGTDERDATLQADRIWTSGSEGLEV